MYRFLNLSYNRITKIENLVENTSIEELHLSSNNIKKIEGLESLRILKVLELGFNNIEVKYINNSNNLCLRRSSLWKIRDY